MLLHNAASIIRLLQAKVVNTMQLPYCMCDLLGLCEGILIRLCESDLLFLISVHFI